MARQARSVLLALVLGALFPAAVLGRAPIPAPAGDVPRFEPAPCPLPAPADVSCGYLVVWENRADPAQGTIRLPVAILPSEAADPAPDPVLYLTGGPGASAIAGVNAWHGHPARLYSDVILLEQRGTRYAEPALGCPEVHDALRENMGLAQSSEAEVSREVAAAATCRDRLVAAGADPSTYNSAASAADVEDLRRVLGYETWNLLGVSYGTRLALTVLRDYPGGVRSAILNSPFPIDVDTYVEMVPNAKGAFHALFADCQADPACAAAYPDLEATFYRVLEETNRHPIEVEVPVPPYRVQLTAKDLVAGVYQLLGGHQTNALLPFLVEQLDRRNADALAPMVESGMPGLFAFSRGMMQSVECYEEAPFNPWPEIEAAARVEPVLLDYLPIHFNLWICDVWPSGQAGPVEDEPVRSDVPVLLLAGAYDPYTPPSWAEHAAETLENGYVYVFPGLGHGPLAYSTCVRRIAADFLADPHTPPDGACIGEMSPPDFLLSSELALNPGIYRLNSDIYTLPNRGRLGLAVACLAIFAVAAIWVPVAWLRARRGDHGGRGDRWGAVALGLGLVIAVLHIAFTIGLFWVIAQVSATSYWLLGFGVPAAYGGLFWLPRLAALLTPGLAALAVWAWGVRVWQPVGRVAYSLLAAAAVAFSGLLLYWGFLPWTF